MNYRDRKFANNFNTEFASKKTKIARMATVKEYFNIIKENEHEILLTLGSRKTPSVFALAFTSYPEQISDSLLDIIDRLKFVTSQKRKFTKIVSEIVSVYMNMLSNSIKNRDMLDDRLIGSDEKLTYAIAEQEMIDDKMKGFYNIIIKFLSEADDCLKEAKENITSDPKDFDIYDFADKMANIMTKSSLIISGFIQDAISLEDIDEKEIYNEED